MRIRRPHLSIASQIYKRGKLKEHVRIDKIAGQTKNPSRSTYKIPELIQSMLIEKKLCKEHGRKDRCYLKKEKT